MAIQKKNGLYYAHVYMGIINGKQKYETSKGFKIKNDAILAELEIKKSVVENNHKVMNKESLSYIATIWLKTREKEIAKTTFKQNKYYYEHWIQPYFGKLYVKDIETIDIFEFMNSLEIAPATINKVMNILKQIFEFAVTLKYIRSNPCNGVKKPSIRKKRKKTLSTMQIKKFLNLSDVKDATCYTAFWILYSTGMRPGEVCGLRWCDFHEDHFTPEYGIDKSREITDLKNDKAHDPVYIDPKLQTHLKKIKTIHKSNCISKGISFSETMFINCFMDDFRPMTVDYLRKAFKRICERNDMEDISLYAATRHSFGTNMMKANVNPKMVADMMRHTTVRTTLDNYSHTDEDMYKQTIQMYNSNII